MTEDQLEQETLGWLAEVGYTPLYGPELAPDGSHPERQNYHQVLLVERLRRALARLNPDIPAAVREDALQQVVDLGIPALLPANRRFHQLLVTGVPVEYVKAGDDSATLRGDFARLIDWSAPEHNEWLAINQYTVKGPHHARRPDIVLFVNGLPLVLIELKNPADANADIWKAFDQIQTYKDQTPDIFQYNEVLVISDGSDARLGSLSANAERFMQWRTINGVTLDPLGEFNELETLIRGVLAPAVLLDYLRFFVLFEDDGDLVKKIAGYHQYHAVRAAILQVIAASRPDGSHKGGVVWHTQGSGKSITMICFAARVMQEAAMENPTIVVITDRNDLDGQLFGTFSLAQDLLREQPVQVTTRQDLRDKLTNRPSGGIVFATIQKFMPGEDEDVFPLLSDRHNIVVIADEAHRTQYGFEAKLKTYQAPKLTAGDGANDANTLLAAEPAVSYISRYQVGRDAGDAGLGADDLLQRRPATLELGLLAFFFVLGELVDFVVQVRQFFGLEPELGEARLEVDRHRGAILLGLLHVVDVDVVAEHRAGVAVLAGYGSAGESDKGRIRQCVAQVLGVADLVA